MCLRQNFKVTRELTLTLESKIKSSEFSVGIVGLGYVGLPLVLAFLSCGIKVVGFDISEDRVSTLSRGIVPFTHLNKIENIKLLTSGDFDAFTSFEYLKSVDVIIICVPTPISKHLEPDLSFVVNACTEVSKWLRPGHLVILESTTYPGTTEEVIAPLLESSGLVIGDTLFLGYSPEREDPANIKYKTKNIPKIVSGITENCLSCTKAVYSHIIDETIPVSTTKVAELTKLVENIHRSVNIGLMNELKPLCIEMGIDIFEVIQAASSKPFGFTPYYPGPGLGGHCIPIDPFYLAWKAKEYGVRTRFIELAGEINTDMPNFVVGQIVKVLNMVELPVRNTKILLLGLAYKKNIEDIRSSPSLAILEMLQHMGASITYSDPFIPNISTATGEFLASAKLNETLLKENEVTVLLTDHDCFDYRMINDFAKMIIDTRGRFKVSNNVVRA